MTRRVGIAADEAFGPVFRDCTTTGCLPVHTFVGGNAWVPGLLQDPRWRLSTGVNPKILNDTLQQAEVMLQKAASVTATLATSDTFKIATVRVLNHTGHKLPTGYPEGRQMWINLQAFNALSTLIFESGAYNWDTGMLTRDVTAKIYEAKQGITPELAAVVNSSPGESFHFVLNNTVIKDNRIPPQGYTQFLYDRPGLRPVGAVYQDGQYWDDSAYTLPLDTAYIRVSLYYQTASQAYMDFLRANGGVDGLNLGLLWESSKSPPVLMARTWAGETNFFFPLILK